MTLAVTRTDAARPSRSRPVALHRPDEERSAHEQCPWLSRYPVRARPGVASRRRQRWVDRLLVLAAAPLWVPLYALAALAVKLDDPSAAVHFAQERTGCHGRRIRVRKLRTMVPNADELKESLRHLNERQWPDFKISDDPRVTSVGRFLRKYSLDELPQLVDVLRGDLALVGPRPTTLAPDAYQVWQMERFHVMPGLTGLWQISARESTSFLERLRLDLAYVERRCLRMDLEILVRTIPAVVRPRGAC